MVEEDRHFLCTTSVIGCPQVVAARLMNKHEYPSLVKGAAFRWQCESFVGSNPASCTWFCGVIGSTRGFDPLSQGSIPCRTSRQRCPQW